MRSATSGGAHAPRCGTPYLPRGVTTAGHPHRTHSLPPPTAGHAHASCPPAMPEPPIASRDACRRCRSHPSGDRRTPMTDVTALLVGRPVFDDVGLHAGPRRIARGLAHGGRLQPEGLMAGPGCGQRIRHDRLDHRASTPAQQRCSKGARHKPSDAERLVPEAPQSVPQTHP